VNSQKHPHIKGILFDLDGTLIDHFKVIYRCYCYALSQLGLQEVSYEKVKSSVGGSIVITFGKLIDESYVDEAVKLFREEYDRIWHEDIIILPHTERLLRQLKDSGYRLGVFTNKEGSNARKVLKECGLADYFEFIAGTLDTEFRKPQKEFSEYALDQFGLTANEVCMIGDSPYDVDAAKVIGMQSYTVATGSHSLEQLNNETATDEAFNDFAELGRRVFNLDFDVNLT